MKWIIELLYRWTHPAPLLRVTVGKKSQLDIFEEGIHIMNFRDTNIIVTIHEEKPSVYQNPNTITVVKLDPKENINE